MSVISGVDYKNIFGPDPAPIGNETLEQVLTDGNDAGGLDIIGVDNLEAVTINGFSTNRINLGEFIAQQTISATANTYFIIELTTPINLIIGVYQANIKINLSATATTGYYIYLYLDTRLLTSSYISSASNINGVSLTIPSFPVGVRSRGGSLILKGKVSATGSVVVASSGDSYIFYNEIYRGINPTPTILVWTAQSGSGSRNWTSIATSTDGLKIIASADDTNTVYKSVNRGVSWTLSLTSTTPSSYFIDVASSADGVNLIACARGNNAYIYTSSDSGATWTPRLQASGGNVWNSCASSSDGVKLIVSSSITDSAISAQVSTDSGVTWTSTFIANGNNIADVASSADGGVLVFAMLGNIYTSVDSGANWVLKYNNNASTVNRVAISSDGNIIYASIGRINTSGINNGIIKSVDSGNTWFNLVTGSVNRFLRISCSSDGSKIISSDSVFVVIDFVPTFQSNIYISKDAGATFSIQTQLGQADWNGLTATPDGGGFVVGLDAGLIYTGDLI
jgi:photosystem II stability/assembly factor-like uncharacterized protein